MLSRKTWETAGFLTIAAALHVSAAAILIPEEELAVMAPGPLAPGSLSAGSGELGELIEKWESQPKAGTAPELSQPEPQAEPEMLEPEVEAPVETAAPQSPTPLEINTSKPNLPEPIEIPKEDLPELESFDPPVIEPALTLAASDRPERRPQKPKPEPEREVRREAAPQPQRQQQPAAAQPQRQAAPSGGGGGGGGGNGQPGNGGGGGGGGALSPGQVANLKGQWVGQIQTCVAKAVRRVTTNIREGGTIVVNINVSPSGAIQGVTPLSSSGDQRADRDVIRAISRVGRCSSAPAGITDSAIFQQGVTIQPR